MKVSLKVIRRYLSFLTEGRAASNPETIDEWETYGLDIDYMIDEARKAGDEELLRLAMDSLLADPKGRIDAFAGQVYAYDDDELQDLFAYAFSEIWPDVPRARRGEGLPMEFAPMSDEEWAVRRPNS